MAARMTTASREQATWYDDHAGEYSAQTLDAPLEELRDRFRRRIDALDGGGKPRRILDLGCGSGRDAKAFLEVGFDVRACDASSRLAELASAHAGIDVQHATFDECLQQQPEHSLDGIWACASLLHVDGTKALVDTLRLAARAIRPGGVMYVSFKCSSSGPTVRWDKGRRFLDMDQPALQDVATAASLCVDSCWTAADSIDPTNRPAWLNALLTTAPANLPTLPVRAAGASGDSPAWVNAMAPRSEGGLALPLPDHNPAEDPAGWILAHVDVETTGLAPGYHEMIDLGVVMTDLHGNELTASDSNTGHQLFMRIDPARPENLEPGAASVNSFSTERWARLKTVSRAQAVDRWVRPILQSLLGPHPVSSDNTCRLLDCLAVQQYLKTCQLSVSFAWTTTQIEFHESLAKGRTCLFCAYNAWFDIAFVDHMFRSCDRTWRALFHYHIIDIPSMLWGLGLPHLGGDELCRLLGIMPETKVPTEHTGLSGALSNVQMYKAMLRVQKSGRRFGFLDQRSLPKL